MGRIAKDDTQRLLFAELDGPGRHDGDSLELPQEVEGEYVDPDELGPMGHRTESIASLVSRFRSHIRHYKSPSTKEAEIRQQFIDPFWAALGWDVGDRKGQGPAHAEVIIEKNVESAEAEGLRTRRPDYIFRVGGFPRFVVEAKKPAVDIDEDRKAIFQAKQYAWNSTIPFAVLTDFEQFRLYDTTPKPIFEEPTRGLVREFSLNYEDFEAQWDVLRETFGRDAVAEGSLEQLLARIKRLRAGRKVRGVDRTLFELKGSEPVDRVFLAHLEAHRRHFATSVYSLNPSEFPHADTLHGAAKLTEAVQRVMDRIVFMRVVEDRGVSPWGQLRDMLDRVSTEGGELYEALCAKFHDYNQRFNGYLYKPHFSEGLRVDGQVLADFIRSLYPPEGPWDFSAIGDDLLGIVYERFLGHTVTVRRHRATIEEKPEVRHAGGVYYTPRFVVDSIIRRVVGPKLEGRSPAEVLDVKILDPACGSGSFLVAALQFLFDYCLGEVARNPKLARETVPELHEGSARRGRKKRSELAFQDKDGQWFLAPDFRAALLTHCIHGVDIDQQAVEVTVMSLYLKMLESKLPDDWARLWVEESLLPPLDNNIRCGNSLIDHEGYDEYLTARRGSLFPEDDDTRFRMNRFDWSSRTRGFGRLLDSDAAKARGRTGFDCIIGNPPYIRVQEMNKWAPEECAYYKWRYLSARGSYDIYVVFVEKALSLLASGGLLGFIMPHKFWQAKYGEGLRRVVAEGRHLMSIVDFREEQVFQSATTYTAIHVFSNLARRGQVDYAAVSDLYDGSAQLNAIDSRRRVAGVEWHRSPHPGSESWTFVPEGHDLMRHIGVDRCRALKDVARLAQGIKTSGDRVFVVEVLCRKGNRVTVRSAQTGQTHVIERGILWPLIKSEHMKRFWIASSEKALIFPYRRRRDGYELISVHEWRNEFPLAWDYLRGVKSVLEARERGRMKDREDWFGYIYPKNFEAMSQPKLVIPDISEHMQVSIDARGEYIFSGGGAGGNAIIPSDHADLEYLCGVLNSRLIEAILRQRGTKFRGGYLNCEIRFIRDLPIWQPQGASEDRLRKRIESSVREIIQCMASLKEAETSDRHRAQLERELEAHERRIDQAVCSLYRVELEAVE